MHRPGSLIGSTQQWSKWVPGMYSVIICGDKCWVFCQNKVSLSSKITPHCNYFCDYLRVTYPRHSHNFDWTQGQNQRRDWGYIIRDVLHHGWLHYVLPRIHHCWRRLFNACYFFRNEQYLHHTWFSGFTLLNDVQMYAPLSIEQNWFMNENSPSSFPSLYYRLK
jgi:hypothetical protein